MRADGQIQINAPPERVWGMVADVTRMGEWSPECVRCEWVDGASGPAVGARFRGHNKIGPMKWSTVSTVTAAEPGKEFAFRVDQGGSVWRYRFEPSDGGTRVSESFEAPPASGLTALFYRLTSREKKIEAAIRQTLERIKTAAETG